MTEKYYLLTNFFNIKRVLKYFKNNLQNSLSIKTNTNEQTNSNLVEINFLWSSNILKDENEWRWECRGDDDPSQLRDENE